MAPTTTQPIPEGPVRFEDAQAQTFGYDDGCNDVSFEVNNESNTSVDAVSVTFTLNEYGATGSYLDPGPTQGPYGLTVSVLPGTQQQLDVQVCPPVSMLLPAPGDYFQVSGVNGSYTWAT
jgi:hypothetical protein